MFWQFISGVGREIGIVLHVCTSEYHWERWSLKKITCLNYGNALQKWWNPLLGFAEGAPLAPAALARKELCMQPGTSRSLTSPRRTWGKCKLWFYFFSIPPKKLPLCHRGAAARLGGCSLASTGEPSTSRGWRGRGTRGTGKVASRGWAVLAASVCSIFCKHHPLERHLHIAWRPGCCCSADYGFLITQGLMWNII